MKMLFPLSSFSLTIFPLPLLSLWIHVPNTEPTTPPKQSPNLYTKAMLDLNLSFVCNDVVSSSDNNLLHLPATTSPIQSSASFNSSSNLTAAGDDEDSSTLNFLSPNDVAADDNAHCDARTIQLFPLAQSVLSSSSSSSSSRKHWLGLSSNSGLEVEPSYYAPAEQIVPLQQRVKKSRRGPRSRSSQYRGVTFYRRTGRWESHIWLVFGCGDNTINTLFGYFDCGMNLSSLTSFLCRDCGKQVYLGKKNQNPPLSPFFFFLFLADYIFLFVFCLLFWNFRRIWHCPCCS